MNENNFYPEGSSTLENKEEKISLFLEKLSNTIFEKNLTEAEVELLVKLMEEGQLTRLFIIHSMKDSEETESYPETEIWEYYYYDRKTKEWIIRVQDTEKRSDSYNVILKNAEIISRTDVIKRLQHLPTDFVIDASRFDESLTEEETEQLGNRTSPLLEKLMMSRFDESLTEEEAEQLVKLIEESSLDKINIFHSIKQKRADDPDSADEFICEYYYHNPKTDEWAVTIEDRVNDQAIIKKINEIISREEVINRLKNLPKDFLVNIKR